MKMCLVRLILPLATLWVRRQERRILANGRPLSIEEKLDARDAGVADVDRVRLMVLSPVPSPGGRLLSGFGRLTRFPMEPPSGMALGHGIYLDTRVAGQRRIFLHECVHISQYERLGGIRPFLRRYLEECLRDSYWNSAMEREANAIADRVCRGEI
ncbi:MAG: hypothetical protein KDN19_12245 [Verrucomicrobiae bacterium]|nr:hypothetical protein [Verrucomicrobiae bacterium]